MGRRADILVVGGGNAERAPAGGYTTKTPIADYLHGLADRFGHCVWLVQSSGTWGVNLAGATERVKGLLDPERVTVIAIEGGIRGALRNLLLFLRYSLQRPYGIFFQPAFITMVAVYPLARLFLRRNVVYLAGDYEVALRDPALQRKWLGWRTLYRGSYEGAMKLADGVIARGRHLADMARRHNDSVIETVPLAHIHGVEPVAARTLDDAEPRRLLYVGLIVASKGLDDLIRAMRIVVGRRAEPPITLDVLGEGPDREAFSKLASELGIGDRVHFHGWVEERETVDRYFAASHAVVMPTSTHAEGVPRVIDEALVRRIPVVATRIAGVPGEFGDGLALLVDPGTPDRLADGIEALLFDPAVRARYVEGAERRRLHWARFESAADQHARFLRGERMPEDTGPGRS